MIHDIIKIQNLNFLKIYSFQRNIKQLEGTVSLSLPPDEAEVFIQAVFYLNYLFLTL